MYVFTATIEFDITKLFRSKTSTLDVSLARTGNVNSASSTSWLTLSLFVDGVEHHSGKHSIKVNDNIITGIH